MNMVHGEVICLHIGQAGIQAGHAFLTQLCAEHGIGPDGVPFRSDCKNPDEFPETLFTNSSQGTFSPRAFCIDTDPGSLDWIKLSECRDLYNPGQMITGLEDAAGCFARGFHHFGSTFSLHGREKIRRVLENCDKFQGYMVFRSMTGGTGSGLSSSLLKRLKDDFTKRTILTLDILPTPLGGSTLDPYNVILGLNQTMDISDVSFLFSNKSLLRIASNQMGIRRPKFTHANQIIATVASHVTNGLRFKSDLSLSLTDLETNLVPLPRLKYPVLAYSPFCPPGRGVSESALSTIVTNLFTRDAQLVPSDNTCGRYLSALLLLRGEFQPDEVNEHVFRLTHHPRTPVRFVDWLPPSMKYSLCTLPPRRPFGWDLGHVPRAAVAALNHTGMEPVIRPFISSFKKMWCNKAYFHLFKQEGMEEQDFLDALENVNALQTDFKTVGDDNPDNQNKKKECINIELPREAIINQRITQGSCGPCRKLNLELTKPKLKLYKCDPGCGPEPFLPNNGVWTCPCRGKHEDFTLYGRPMERPIRHKCPSTDKKKSNSKGQRKSKENKSKKKSTKNAECCGPLPTTFC